MEQKQYFPKAQKRRMRRERLKKWFSETFRAHSKEEYKEFFTRGFDGKESVNKVYPWLYMRALAFCFVIFAVSYSVMFITMNGISLPAVTFLGAALANIPFIILIYELCPKSEISFLKLMLVLIIGGTASVLLMELGYLAFTPPKGYGQIAWVAFLEEVAKIIPAITAIMLLKKRKSPLASFAVAAAVGAGISLIEDMGYIFSYSYENGISMTVTVSIVRGISSVATHTVWVGYVGWIFSKCRRPLLDIRFYAICLMSMALHFMWDLVAANEQLWSMLGMLFGFIFCICFTRWIFKKERAAVFNAEALPLATGVTADNANAVQNASVEKTPEAADEGTAEVVAEENSETKNIVTDAENTDSETIAETETQAENKAVTVAETAAADSVAIGTAEENESAARAETAATGAASAEYTGAFIAANYFNRQQAGENNTGKAETKPLTPREAKEKKRARYCHMANMFATAAALIISSLLIGACSANIGYGNEVKTYFAEDKQQFLNFVQDGNNLHCNWERPFVEREPYGNYYAYNVLDGKLTDVTEIVDGKYYYSYYWYEPSKEENKNIPESERKPAGWYIYDISVKIDGRMCPAVMLAEAVPEEGIYEDESCFIVRDDIVGCSYESIFGMYTVTLDNVVFYGLVSLIGYAVGMGLVLFTGVLLFSLFKVKAKNLAKELAAQENAATESAATESAATDNAVEENIEADSVSTENNVEESGVKENTENAE